MIDTETRHAHKISDEQVESLRKLGWTDEQIFEGLWVGAAFAYMTRIVDAFGIQWQPSMLNAKALGTKKMD